MKKQFTFHWGWRIGVVYTLFVIGTLTMVVIAFRTEVDLVRDDYYEHSLQHDKHNAGRHNAKKLSAGSFHAKIVDNNIKLTLPFVSDEVASGEVQLYRPSTATTDEHYTLTLDTAGVMRMSTAGLASGFWRVKCNFTARNTYYELEIPIQLP